MRTRGGSVGVGRMVMRMVARVGLGAALAAAVACGDDEATDEGAETGEPTSTGPSTDGTSTGPDPGTSDSSTGSGSTGPGTTSAVDDTSTGDGATTSSEETAIPAVAFDQVLAIIAAECFCHRSPMFPGQLDLRDDAAYASLVSVPSAQVPRVDRVVPGDPDGSYLYLKLLGDQASVGGGGTRMPQGAPMLPAEDLDTVRYWILGGADP